VAVPLAQLAEAFDRAAERELRSAEALDEVAAAAETEGLQRAQLAVDRAVAPGDPFGADGLAGDDPVALEQQLRQGAAVGSAGEEPGRRRPPSLRGGDLARSPARETPRAL